MKTADGFIMRENQFYYRPRKLDDGVWIVQGFTLKKDMGINTSNTFREINNCTKWC